ncbi:DnrP protein [Pseudomonas zhanjiangensis]|uniref:DnrP protein n=1 Tax=Pseudomonas zhanjiangensis TaxID=3239015 RepID=A0ABV3YWH2_9PSED
MPSCLYCQQDNPAQEADCLNCGMPLPALAERAGERKQRRFLWFCIGLSLFCALMILWLPRSIS